MIATPLIRHGETIVRPLPPHAAVFLQGRHHISSATCATRCTPHPDASLCVTFPLAARRVHTLSRAVSAAGAATTPTLFCAVAWLPCQPDSLVSRIQGWKRRRSSCCELQWLAGTRQRCSGTPSTTTRLELTSERPQTASMRRRWCDGGAAGCRCATGSPTAATGSAFGNPACAASRKSCLRVLSPQALCRYAFFALAHAALVTPDDADTIPPASIVRKPPRSIPKNFLAI